MSALRRSSTVVRLAIAVTLAVTRQPLGAIVVLFLVVVPFEKLFPRHRQRLRRPGVGTDIAYALLATPLNLLGLAVGVVLAAVSLLWLPGLLLRPLVSELPFGVRAVLGFVLFEVVFYWGHRAAHEVPFLWRFHKIHHSSARLDWVSGFRVHPLDGVLFAPPFVFLLAAGFQAQAAGALVALQLAFGIFLHANVRWRLRPLQKIVGTPEFHHWHHANVPEAHHTNYAGLLPALDLAFGTYRVPADERPEVYGVDEEISEGMVGQLRDPFRGMKVPRRAASVHSGG